MDETPAHRVRELRRLLGDGTYPLSQAKLAARLTELSGKHYHATMVTKMELGQRRVHAEDARWLAALDPQHRGVEWVLCWPDEATAPLKGKARRGPWNDDDASERGRAEGE